MSTLIRLEHLSAEVRLPDGVHMAEKYIAENR